MNGGNDRSDLPVPRDDHLLPLLLPGAGPEHKQVSAEYGRWSNLVSQQYARGLAVSSDGEVWLATDGGVIRWSTDLSRFTRYASEHGLPGNSILAVAVSGNGLPWAVHIAGLLSYLDNNTWKIYEPLRHIEVACLSVDITGALWVATSEGVYRIVDPVGLPYKLSAIDEEWAVTVPTALAVMNEGDVWLCTARGVYHHDGVVWQEPHEIRGVLALARQGDQLWLGTVCGLLRVTPATGESISANTWPQGAVTALAAADGGVWMACGNQVGLATESDWRQLGNLSAGRRVSSLAIADSDAVWIATDAGLARGEPTGIHWRQTEAPPEIISTPGLKRVATFSNLIQTLAVQRYNDYTFLWIGTPRGLFRLDLCAESWRAYTQPGLRDVRALTNGTDADELWAASWEGGLYRLKGRIIHENIPAVPRTVMTLAAGPGEERWAAVALGLETSSSQPAISSDGIYRGTGSRWSLAIPTSRLRVAGLAAGGLVQTVIQAQDRHVWIGTSAGLFVYEPDTDQLEAVGGAVGGAHVRILLAPSCPFDSLWAGTSRGLYRCRIGVWTLIPELENRLVTALTWDGEANTLWIGTDSGLVKLSPAGGDWHIAGEWNSRNSGLAADYITALTLSASNSGETQLWIGTPHGLSGYRYPC